MISEPTSSGLEARIRKLEAVNRRLKQKLRSAKNSEARFRTLYMTAPVGMYEIDLDQGCFTAVNNYVLERVGYSREAFMRLKPTDLLTATSREQFFRRLEKIRSGQPVPKHVEYQIQLKNGRRLWALFDIRYIRQDDRICGATVAIYDNDERKKAEIALRNSERRFRTLVETMAEGLAMMNAQGDIVYINRRLADMSGYPAEELVGRNVREVIDPQAIVPLEDILTGHLKGEGQSYEFAWTDRFGRQNTSILSPQTLYDADDRFCGTFAVVTDITEQKKTQRALKNREKELKQKNIRLEEINTALRTLVKIREEDKTEIEETVVASIHQLADPLLSRLKTSGLNERQKSYVAILEANLKEIIAPFARQIAPQYLELTPAEVEVANLVKHGRKSKEIASLLNISVRTVEMHRRNMRKKLGLRHTNANLRTFLLSR